MEVRPWLTGGGRERLDLRQAIEDGGKDGAEAGVQGGGVRGKDTWVYISGPNAFIQQGEAACREAGVGFFGARWS